MGSCASMSRVHPSSSIRESLIDSVENFAIQHSKSLRSFHYRYAVAIEIPTEQFVGRICHGNEEVAREWSAMRLNKEVVELAGLAIGTVAYVELEFYSRLKSANLTVYCTKATISNFLPLAAAERGRVVVFQGTLIL